MVVRSQPLRCQIGGLCQHCSITTCSVSRVYLIMWAVWGQSNSSPATLHLCNGNFTPCCILMFYETAGSGWLSPASAKHSTIKPATGSRSWKQPEHSWSWASLPQPELARGLPLPSLHKVAEGHGEQVAVRLISTRSDWSSAIFIHGAVKVPGQVFGMLFQDYPLWLAFIFQVSR